MNACVIASPEAFYEVRRVPPDMNSPKIEWGGICRVGWGSVGGIRGRSFLVLISWCSLGSYVIESRGGRV